MYAHEIKTRARCRFRLADVICPDAGEIQQQVTPDLKVAGEIVFLSDRGDEPDRFAIVEVEGIGAPLIVPVERIESLGPSESNLREAAKPIRHE